MSNEARNPLFAKNDQKVDFSPKKFDQKTSDQDSWKVLVVDDEPEVHDVTRLALRKFEFQGKHISLLNAYSAQTAGRLMQTHPDTAVVLLDVVMERDDAGLELIKYIREVLRNQTVRIILRTGQPGQAPERKIVLEYDINDYKLKTELTTEKFFTTLITALRSYQYITLLAERTAELKKTNEKLRQEIKQRKRAEEDLKIHTTELEQSNRELWKNMMEG